MRLWVLWALAVWLLCPAPSRAGDTLYTSTREVSALTVDAGGTLWVTTPGGVLQRDPSGDWHEWTRAAPPPTPPPAAPNRAPDVLCRAVWRGSVVTATVGGLQTGGRTIPLPSGSLGTHVSALLPRGRSLWAALYGDGLWAWDGQAWRPAPLAVPPAAREITALAAGADGTVWLGTRRAGVWEHGAGGWRQHVGPDEPAGNDAQALCVYDGRVFVSTLEDGLAVFSAQGWQSVAAPTLSSDAPRQMAVFRGALYVRHGGGQVDRLDGAVWTRGVCSELPRRQASALAADESALYVAQWGGWSEWDGAHWTHHLRLPELQGVPVTALCPDGGTLWVGTQGRGLLAYDRATGRLRRLPPGLPDDWVTCLARANGAVYAGTFVGGLARWDGTRWSPLPKTASDDVTDLTSDSAGGLYAATRRGVWRCTPSGMTPLAASHPLLDPEAQCLCLSPGGLWVGTRIGLYRLTLPDAH